MVGNTQVAFSFVQRLAGELSAGRLELPSLPDVVIQVRMALDAGDFDIGQLAQVVAAEPALAGRIVGLANSALMNRSGKPVTDLRTAVMRVGSEMVRSTAMSFAMEQLRRAGDYREFEHLLKPEWERSTRLAGLCCVLARRERELSAEQALLLGLVHNVGALYLLGRAGEMPGLVADEAALLELAADWHPGIGQAITESWGLPDEACAAVGQQRNPEPVKLGHPTLLAVLVEALELDALEQGEAEASEEWLAASVLRQRLAPDLAALAALRAEVGPAAAEVSASLRL